MLHLTFIHTRNLFTGNSFKPWVKKLFPSARFEGCASGSLFPVISVPFLEFESGKDRMPLANLIKISGSFRILEQLTFGVRDFSNSL